MKCIICKQSVVSGSNYFAQGSLRRPRNVEHAKCRYVKEGYDAAIADVVAFLRGHNQTDADAIEGRAADGWVKTWGKKEKATNG